MFSFCGANDILWQLGVFAYNLPVMMRQKKNKFKRSEYRTFIDRFISVSAKINGSGHQMELKLYEHHFTKLTGKSLTSSSKQHKNKERRKI